MPFIDLKVSKTLTEEKKEVLKSRLGEIISLLHKPESYLMIGIADGYSMYFAGKKLENGAYVEVKLFGKVSSADSEKMTQAVCGILKDELCTDGKNIYITYQGITDWGWNGANF